MSNGYREEKLTARYYHSNGFAVAVVASVSYGKEKLLDWAAYIGGTDRTWREQDAVDWVAKRGDKLSREDARYYFPSLPINKYR